MKKIELKLRVFLSTLYGSGYHFSVVIAMGKLTLNMVGITLCCCFECSFTSGERLLFGNTYSVVAHIYSSLAVLAATGLVPNLLKQHRLCE